METTRDMFDQLEQINSRPDPFEFYTAADLWTDDHTSKQMLAYHLNTDIDVSSRRGEFIDQSVAWIGSHFNVGTGTRIADFGCGPGLYANRLAKLGASTVAAQAGLKVAYVNQNYLEFETEDCFDIILMIMCDFCALSPAQRMTMLEKFQLRPARRLFPECFRAPRGGCLLRGEPAKRILVT